MKWRKCFSKQAISLVLALCLSVGTVSPVFSNIAYAVEDTSTSSTSAVVEEGEPVLVLESAEPDSEPVDEEGDTPPVEDETPEPETTTPDFVALTVLDPETGATIEAEVGDEVTLHAGVNRDDVEVVYQWQKLQKPMSQDTSVNALYKYGDGAPTWYNFPVEDEICEFSV